MSKKNREADRASRAAAALAEQQREERRRRNLMVGGVVAVLLVIVVGGFFLARALDTTTDVDAPAAGSEFGLTIGPDDAPHSVIIYEDFLCPYCGELERASGDGLAELAADGKVQVEYRPFVLLSTTDDRDFEYYSERAAGAFQIVLEESGAEVAKEFHDLLFENQPSEAGPFPSDDDLIDLAVEAGAEESDVRDRIESQDGADAAARATQAAADAGVNSTPTVLLDGEVFQDGRTMDELAENLIAQLQ
ncbi:thioredoxin domain-containing protein [Nocardioides sp. SR21]|uniref:DsbA family protein n=1 Tax=Nocardioides sp. SR21 TaxID=2919501 RepID=UPI001FA9C359|nr:thioredoxin domain-containing protein [Nocardioides sp. SR21]